MKTRNVSVIVLYDEKKRILLQHRDENAKRYPGKWAFFGGGIENGESPEEAVRRECLEELCYKLENPRLIIAHDFRNSMYQGKKYVFAEKYDPNKKLLQKEGQAMGWFFIEDTDKLETVEHDKEVYDFLKLILQSL